MFDDHFPEKMMLIALHSGKLCDIKGLARAARDTQ
jgi:hypothetical protein